MAPRSVIFGCHETELSPTEKAFFRDADPWGFILFARNIATPEQVCRLTGDLRDTVGRDAPILIDQEGGRVARLRAPHWREWDNALAFVAGIAPGNQVAAMRLRYRMIAQDLRALGIDVNCAPMVDIAQSTTHKDIRERCYGTSPAEVARLGRAVAQGLEAGGVLAVLKHMPGHGRTPLDSHIDLPVVTESLAVLDAEDFAPFRALSDLPMAMTAHIVFSALDGTGPATFSRPMISFMREKIGFDGLLMTDDLSMHALRGSFQSRTERALAAGCDIILHCNGMLQEMFAVADAASLLEGEALRRADRALAARPDPNPVPMAELAAELETLLPEARNAG